MDELAGDDTPGWRPYRSSRRYGRELAHEILNVTTEVKLVRAQH